MTLETGNGKLIQIQSAQIIVSANPHSEVGWYSDIQIKAILPGCRRSGCSLRPPRSPVTSCCARCSITTVGLTFYPRYSGRSCGACRLSRTSSFP